MGLESWKKKKHPNSPSRIRKHPQIPFPEFLREDKLLLKGSKPQTNALASKRGSQITGRKESVSKSQEDSNLHRHLSLSEAELDVDEGEWSFSRMHFPKVRSFQLVRTVSSQIGESRVKWFMATSVVIQWNYRESRDISEDEDVATVIKKKPLNIVAGTC